MACVTVDILAHIRVGLNIVDLRRVRTALSPARRSRPCRTLLKDLARTYRTSLDLTDTDLMGRIDAALARAQLREPPAKDDALLALVGIRRGLFPAAPPYRPQRRTNRRARASRRMNHEIDIYGVFVPDLLVWVVVAFLISVSASAPAGPGRASTGSSGTAPCSMWRSTSFFSAASWPPRKGSA